MDGRHWQRVGLGRVSRLLVVVAIVLMGWATTHYAAGTVAADGPSANVTVVTTGLNGPRGLKFGPDGNLYVAEAGMGGQPTSTVGTCEQVPAPVGPYSGGKTARISRIAPDGTARRWSSGLPSSRDSAMPSAIGGRADVEFIGNTLYAITGGGGCSHGVPDFPNTILKVNADGTYPALGDLGAFLKAHPVAKPEADDFEPDGTWYSMVNVGGALYALEPNHGELDKVTPDGQISRVVDISASQGHIVPTAMVYHDGNFYVGNLSGYPMQDGVREGPEDHAGRADQRGGDRAVGGARRGVRRPAGGCTHSDQHRGERATDAGDGQCRADDRRRAVGRRSRPGSCYRPR